MNLIDINTSQAFLAWMECVRAISDPISYIRGARVNANALAVEYVIKNNLEGDIIEIGVWKGGSIVIMLLTLERLGIGNKHVHLYDTFEGMTPCTDSDIDLGGRRASDLIAQDPRLWLAVSALQEVQDNIAKHTKYPSSLIHSLKKAVKITPHKAVQNLNPPADKGLS